MCPCPLCGCSSRTGTIVVGIVAATNYFLQLLAILLHEGYLIAEFSTEQYHAFVFNHFLVFTISLLMLVGAVQRNKWLLLPFIVFVGIQDVISLVVAAYVAQSLVLSPSNGMLALFLVSSINFFLITWILWIVTLYFRHLHSGYLLFSENDDDVIEHESRAIIVKQYGHHHHRHKPRDEEKK